MKTLKQITITMLLLATLVGCKRTFENKNVEITPNRELGLDFLKEYGIDRFSGDITYKAKKEIALQEDRRCIFEYEGDYCPDEDEYEVVTFFNIDSIGDKQDYSIISQDKGGFRLAVKASVCGEHCGDIYFKRYLYKKITLVHPLSMPHDSIVCTNVKYVGGNYGFELSEYASRPCAGKIKVYRVYDDGNYLLKEVVEANGEKTVWKEYYIDGNIKSIKTIVANPEEFDEYGMFSACPFLTNGQYYLPDGSESCEDIDKLDNLVEEIVGLQHLYYLTRDKSIEQEGDRLCRELNSFSRTMERQIKKGKYTLEQQDRINKIIDRLK